MKNLLIVAIILGNCFLACKSQEEKKKDEEQDTKAEKDKKVSARDLSITRSNSYTNIFLDSAAVENFITEKKTDDGLARRIRSFYNTRNYQFAWFSSDGLTEQALGFWNLHNHYTTYSEDSSLVDKALKKKMDNLISVDTMRVNAADKSLINTELTLTQHFIEYSLKNFEKGYIKRKEMERFIPRKKENALELADSLLTKKHKDDKYYEDVNEAYKQLKEQLQKYFTITKNGGWQPVSPEVKKLKKGSSSPAIVAVKRRLVLTGDMAGGDTSEIFTDTLDTGIKNFQQRHGYTPNGIITDALIKEMNVPAQTRLQQLLINMERMRWMPSQPEGNLILVNIPEFVLHVFEGKKEAFEMNVVVGKEGHNTMMFTGNLSQIVFSPYWNVPQSIVQKEILPAMQRNPNYLASQNMEVTGESDGLPEIRQLPGAKNSLGKVKFLFPNSFNIYFHDTPAKSLFQQDKRAFSHGCIRLSEPEKMAQYLLRDQPEWTPSKIQQAMNAGNEKFVKLKDPVPVFITYYTAWVDENGQLNFRGDIYNRDGRLAKKMFM
jgi:murein L,D-transpeptidase YcbB/YkuD